MTSVKDKASCFLYPISDVDRELFHDISGLDWPNTGHNGGSLPIRLGGYGTLI